MEAIGTLASGIAHDFNNILSPIMGYTELILLQLPIESPLRHPIEQVRRAGKLATDLVNQILAFCRKREQEMVYFSMGSTIHEVLELLRASLPATISIREKITAESDILFADPTQIHQVLMNLCTNASQAMEETGGVLEVHLSNELFGSESEVPLPNLKAGPYLKLTVNDTGPGIDPRNLERIFEPYFTTKNPGKGTGLGLAVVHGIVKSSGGGIVVDSGSERGTSFHVYLPCPSALYRDVRTERAGETPGGREHILWVDDEELILDFGKQSLESLGYTVEIRRNGIEALDLFRAKPEAIDLVVTDMTMPGMTGEKLSEEILRIRPDMPIILITGFSELITEQKAKALGIRAFFMKPVVFHELAEAVRKTLDGLENTG